MAEGHHQFNLQTCSILMPTFLLSAGLGRCQDSLGDARHKDCPSHAALKLLSSHIQSLRCVVGRLLMFDAEISLAPSICAVKLALPADDAAGLLTTCPTSSESCTFYDHHFLCPAALLGFAVPS